MTVSSLYREGLKVLSSSGIKNAAHEVMWLLESAVGLTRLAIFKEPTLTVSFDAAKEAKEFFDRRAKGEPLQYILGSQEFCGLLMRVSPDVLIPRPETELIIEEVLAHPLASSNPIIADIGTGSGCLAIALAVKFPTSRIFATDQEPKALKTALGNAIDHGVDHRTKFLLGNLFDPLKSEGLEGRLTGIVSNPPYIRSSELPRLPLDVRDFEPHSALDGGTDGMVFYRRILHQAWSFLCHGGFLVLETGLGQTKNVVKLAQEIGGYTLKNIRCDAAHIERVLRFERKG